MDDVFITYPELYQRIKEDGQNLLKNWMQYLFWLKSLRPQFYYDYVADQYGIEDIKLSHDNPTRIVVEQREGCPLVGEEIVDTERKARLFDYLPPKK